MGWEGDVILNNNGERIIEMCIENKIDSKIHTQNSNMIYIKLSYIDYFLVSKNIWKKKL